MLIFVFVFFVSIGKEVLACSFVPQMGTSSTPVTIKIADTYFEIPEKYLYTFEAVPAERSDIRLNIPHRSSVTLTKEGESGYGCGSSIIIDGTYAGRLAGSRRPISDNIDICSDDRNLLSSFKLEASSNPPLFWELDLALANKFDLGMDGCGGGKPLSWDGLTNRSEITQGDILYGLAHKNTQIRNAAKSFIRDFFRRSLGKTGLNIVPVLIAVVIGYAWFVFRNQQITPIAASHSNPFVVALDILKQAKIFWVFLAIYAALASIFDVAYVPWLASFFYYRYYDLISAVVPLLLYLPPIFIGVQFFSEKKQKLLFSFVVVAMIWAMKIVALFGLGMLAVATGI